MPGYCQTQNGLRLVILSMELCFDVFSGNGVLGRVLVNSLLRADPLIQLLVITGKNLDNAQDATADGTGFVSHDLRHRITVVGVPLPKWKRLDHLGPYQEFTDAVGGLDVARSIESFHPDAVITVDYTGWMASASVSALSRIPSVWLCFRVFHATKATAAVPATAIRLYRTWEAQARRQANITVALSDFDVQSLTKLTEIQSSDSTQSNGAAVGIGKVVFPPLRGDLFELASTGGGEGYHKKHTGGITDQRRYLTCCCRLAPEKNVEAFVAVVESIGQASLAELNLVPRLVGSGSDTAYVESIHSRLRAACPAALIEPFSSDPHFLATVFSETWLNFHPSLYEAFGMTIVEAAAFGAPTMLHNGGAIGAAELLHPEQHQSIAADLTDIASTAETIVRTLVVNSSKVANVASSGRERALQNNENAYGTSILDAIGQATAS